MNSNNMYQYHKYLDLSLKLFKYNKDLKKKKIWNDGNFLLKLPQKYKKKAKFKINGKKRTFIKNPVNLPSFLQVFLNNLNFYSTRISLKYFNIIRKPRNIFINISNIRGKVLKHYSSGMLHKNGSERRTYVAFTDLLEHCTPIKLKRRNKKQKFNYVIRIRATNLYRTGFKRNIKMFLKSLKLSKIGISKLIGVKFKAHNGVRKKRKKRK